MGSKNKIAKYILPIMLAEKGDRTWVEPFVGGANMIDKIDGYRIGNDLHFYLISLLKALQNGFVPPTEITREFYYYIKSGEENFTPELIGFVGFLCSFGGKWWNGYAFNKKGDNYAERGSRVLVKQAENFKDVVFTCGSYLDLDIPDNSIIYCDPPYNNTTKYKDSFDSEKFYQWCRDMANKNHIVYVSEYDCPKDFTLVKTVEVKSTLNKNSQDIKFEKLFRL